MTIMLASCSIPSQLAYYRNLITATRCHLLRRVRNSCAPRPCGFHSRRAATISLTIASELTCMYYPSLSSMCHGKAADSTVFPPLLSLPSHQLSNVHFCPYYWRSWSLPLKTSGRCRAILLCWLRRASPTFVSSAVQIWSDHHISLCPQGLFSSTFLVTTIFSRSPSILQISVHSCWL